MNYSCSSSKTGLFFFFSPGMIYALFTPTRIRKAIAKTNCLKQIK